MPNAVSVALLACVTAASSFSVSAQTYTRTKTITYHDDASKWVLGQVAQTAVNGMVALETAYDANAQPVAFKSFGKTVQVMTYSTDGTIATIKDGNNNVTHYSSWKRGVPQTTKYADSTIQAAVVDDNGWITRVSDENGYATNYGYDTMGRLASIVYPTGDSTAWNTTTQAFQQVAAAEYGIPAGHWRQTVATGNARKITYFDALWRPLVTREYDTANEAGTQRFQRFTYDHEGRVTFASYPGTSSALSSGAWTEYDALGRTTSVSQDSELGLLITTTSYLSNASGPYTRVTTPRGQQIRTWYQMFEQPSYDHPTRITHPEGAITDIVRDVFGKPTSITRRNNNSSVTATRSYVYDAYQQLCKSIEPETGSTIMAYDGSGNLAWRASGQTYPSTSSCNTADVTTNQKVSRTYDARNRIKVLAFPDGRGNQTWSYTPDGLPSQVSTNNSSDGDTVVNTYTYNKRRLPTGEAVIQGSTTLNLGYGYTANGHLASHVYPSGLIVAYTPNALGQPTRAGTYATGVTYYPNGAIKGFTYGNGIAHLMTQNARQLPARSTDLGGANPLDLGYSYDANANVSHIVDYTSSGRQTRSMTYDGLDRLLTTHSVMFGSDNEAKFSYDVLDNLISLKVGGVYNYIYAYNSKWQLETVRQAVGGAAIIGLSYDAWGNLANKNGVLHQFDYGNRLREVADRESYAYDAHGRRVRSTSPALGDIQSFYDMGGVLRYQHDDRLSETNEFIHLGNSLVAKVSNSTMPPPDTPPTVTAPANSTTGNYTVSWTGVATATSYRLEERKDGGSWSEAYSGSATSRTFSGKTNGAYDYRAKACNAGGCSSYSVIKTTTVLLPAPGAPTVTAPANSSTGSYTVSWTSVAIATGYRLEERVNGGSWSEIYNGTAMSRAISGKGNGTYDYRARACNASGCSSYSTVKTTTVLFPPATAPTVTAPASSTTGSYTISWTSVATATRYRLEERKDGGSWSEVHNAAAMTKAISGKGNGIYGYRAQACNASGCGSYSAIKTTTVLLPPAAAPTVSAPASSTVGSYTVSWTSVDTASSYRLEERLNGGAWTQVADISGVSKWMSDKPNGTYGYRARACNTSGCGPYSAVKQTSVQVSYIPTSFVVRYSAVGWPQTTTYYFIWDAVAGATRYEINTQKQQTITLPSGTAIPYQTTMSGPPMHFGSEYRIRSCNDTACSEWSSWVTHTPL